MAIVIGCDMHTRFQQLAVLDTESGVIEELRRENEPLEEVRRLYARWPAPATVAIEATGYARWFSELMAELGHTLVVGDPAKLRAMAIRKQKTDRRDALHLAAVYARGDFPRVWAAGPEAWEIRHLLRRRQLAVNLRRQVKIRLQGLAMSRGLRRGPHLHTRAGQRQLAELALPPQERAHCDEACELLAEFNRRVEALDQAAEARAAAEPRACLLRTHPGVGPVTALAWLAWVGEAKRFTTSNQLVSYVGLNPSEYSSGGGRQKLGHISKQGNRYLRHLLVEAAVTAGRLDPVLARFYRRKLAAKHLGAARVAVARKLAVRMYWMDKRSATYSDLWGDADAGLPVARS
jgi:transposase